MANGIQLAPLLTSIQVDIQGFKTQMQKVTDEVNKKSKEMTEQFEKSINIGEKINSAGSKLIKGLTIPLVGVGTAMGKMALDFESSFAKVTTLLDENVVNFDDYKKDILNASSESKVAVDEFSEAVYQSISAGIDQTKAIEFTTKAMQLAKGGFTDGASAVDILTTAINGYGLEMEDASKISDILISTQNLGKTTVDELASSMGSVIPVANNANFAIDELGGAYALLTSKGISTSEAGTYIKSMLSELTKTGSQTDTALRELSGKGFAELKAEGKSTSDILNMLSGYAEQNGLTLKDMFGSVEAGSSALVLASEGGAEYNAILEKMGNSAGATQEAFDKIDKTPMEQLKGALNELKNAGIELGIKLIPIVQKVAEWITKMVEKFNGLSDSQKENILKWGGLLIAIGPVLKIVGTLTSGYGKLGKGLLKATGFLGKMTKASKTTAKATKVLGATAKVSAGAGGIGGLTTGLGGVVSSLGGVVGAVAPYALAVGAIGAVAYGVHKVLSRDVVPQVDLFGDKVSENTRKAVESYMELDDGVSKTLYNVKTQHTVITDEIATELSEKYTTMGQTILTKQKENFDNLTKNTSEYFAESDVLSAEREAEVLANLQTNYNTQQNVVQNAQNRILEIIDNAKKQNRELTEKELEEITFLQEQMRNSAIDNLSETEQEANLIRERMKEYQGRLSVEMASELIQSAKETRDKEIQTAQEKYEGIIKEANQLRKAGVITDEEYNKMVNSARETRDEQIKKAREGMDGIVKEIKEGTPDIENAVNLQTGKIMSWYESCWKKVSDWISDINNKTPEVMTRGQYDNMRVNGVQYNGLNYVPFDGYTARLHKGERVLTAKENQAYMQGKYGDDTNTGNGLSLNISNFINNRKDDVRELAEELEFYRRNYSLGYARR